MSDEQFGRVVIDVRDGVADVRLNRPDKRNALDGAMFLAIAAAGERLIHEPGVRAVVLSGEGASFCAGLDFGGFLAMAAGEPTAAPTEESGHPGSMVPGRITHLAQQICWVWQEVPVPVIAALHGHALGGGLQLALGADVRIAHPGTKLSVREGHWGLIPDMTGTFVLSQLVRPDIAKELTFTARIFEAVEGERLGVVTRLADDPHAAATALAAEIAGNSPDAVRAAKTLFARRFHAGAAEHLRAERDAIAALIGAPNQVEAVTAEFERRPPAFTDPSA
ncbi:crotonase/enoyl-CoA hydratase family protein [soil metagenome]